MTAARWAVVAGLLISGGLAQASLEQARAEKNLGKRSQLALDNAVAAIKDARQAYKAGNTRKVAQDAAEIEESVEYAHESLLETGKNPRKSPKWFKRAEIESRNLLRNLEDFQEEMSYNDRGMLDKAKTKTQQVHDDLLTGLMEGKRK